MNWLFNKWTRFLASVTCSRYQIAFKWSVNFWLQLFSLRWDGKYFNGWNFYLAFFKFKKTEPAEISKRTRVCIHCSFRKQKCRLKSTTTNGCRHFGQSEQRKSSILFPIQSEKSPDSDFFTCDPTKKCIMPSSRERHKGIIGKGHDLRLRVPKSQVLTHASQCPRPLVPPLFYTQP